MIDSSFVEVYSRLGKRHYSSKSGQWIAFQHGLLTAVPYASVLNLSIDEINGLLNKPGVWGLKYSAPVDSFGFDSGFFVASSPYNLNSLTSKARNQYRKGLKFCTFRQINFDELVQDAYELNLSTFSRQGRSDPKADKINWFNFCRAICDVESAKAYGVFCDDHLAAYAIVLESCGIAEIIHQASSIQYLKYCPNNLLTYGITDLYLNSLNLKMVSYGLRSIESTDSLEHYKLSMGYRLQLTKQVIVLNSFIRFLISLNLDLFVQFLIRKLGLNSYAAVKLSHLIDKYRSQSVGNK